MNFGAIPKSILVATSHYSKECVLVLFIYYNQSVEMAKPILPPKA